MDKLNWFKFAPADWMMGKIIRCPEVTQARFLKLCCLYWNKETNLSEEDSRIEVDDEHFEILLKKKIITSNGENIIIDFLDVQFDNILETSKKASKAGKASAAKRKAIAQQKVNDRSTTVQHIPTDKIEIREDKIREEESEGQFTPEQFLKWFNESRTKNLEKESNINYLSEFSRLHLEILTSKYSGNDFSKAFHNICNDKWANESNNIMPKHFLNPEQFTKYLDMEVITLITKKQKKNRGWISC